jgi:hypothetical protein
MKIIKCYRISTWTFGFFLNLKYATEKYATTDYNILFGFLGVLVSTFAIYELSNLD